MLTGLQTDMLMSAEFVSMQIDVTEGEDTPLLEDLHKRAVGLGIRQTASRGTEGLPPCPI